MVGHRVHSIPQQIGCSDPSYFLDLLAQDLVSPGIPSRFDPRSPMSLPWLRLTSSFLGFSRFFRYASGGGPP